MNRILRKYRRIFFAAVVLLICSYKPLLTREIRDMFQKNGLDNIELYIDSVSLTHARLKYIVIGDEKPLEIGQADIDYSLPGLWRHHVKSILLNNVSIEADVKGDKLSLNGLDSAIRESIPGETSYILPEYFFQADNYFFDTLIINNGTLHIAGKGIDLNSPFVLAIRKTDTYRMMFDFIGFSGKAWDYNVTGDEISGTLALNAKERWAGPWDTKSIALHTGKKPLANVDLSGSLSIDNSQADIGFDLQTTLTPMDARGVIRLQQQKSFATLYDAGYPWGGGTVSVHNTTIPFYSPSTINVTLTLQDVAMNNVFPLLIAPAAGGSGTLSGELSFGYIPPNNLVLYKGTLSTEQPGSLSIPAEFIAHHDMTDKEFGKIGKLLKLYDYDRLALQLKSVAGNIISVDLRAIGHGAGARNPKPDELKTTLDGNIAYFIDKLSILPVKKPHLLPHATN